MPTGHAASPHAPIIARTVPALPLPTIEVVPDPALYTHVWLGVWQRDDLALASVPLRPPTRLHPAHDAALWEHIRRALPARPTLRAGAATHAHAAGADGVPGCAGCAMAGMLAATPAIAHFHARLGVRDRHDHGGEADVLAPDHPPPPTVAVSPVAGDGWRARPATHADSANVCGWTGLLLPPLEASWQEAAPDTAPALGLQLILQYVPPHDCAAPAGSGAQALPVLVVPLHRCHATMRDGVAVPLRVGHSQACVVAVNGAACPPDAPLPSPIIALRPYTSLLVRLFVPAAVELVGSPLGEAELLERIASIAVPLAAVWERDSDAAPLSPGAARTIPTPAAPLPLPLPHLVTGSVTLRLSGEASWRQYRRLAGGAMTRGDWDAAAPVTVTVPSGGVAGGERIAGHAGDTALTASGMELGCVLMRG